MQEYINQYMAQIHLTIGPVYFQTYLIVIFPIP